MGDNTLETDLWTMQGLTTKAKTKKQQTNEPGCKCPPILTAGYDWQMWRDERRRGGSVVHGTSVVSRCSCGWTLLQAWTNWGLLRSSLQIVTDLCERGEGSWWGYVCSRPRKNTEKEWPRGGRWNRIEFQERLFGEKKRLKGLLGTIATSFSHSSRTVLGKPRHALVFHTRRGVCASTINRQRRLEPALNKRGQ